LFCKEGGYSKKVNWDKRWIERGGSDVVGVEVRKRGEGGDWGEGIGNRFPSKAHIFMILSITATPIIPIGIRAAEGDQSMPNPLKPRVKHLTNHSRPAPILSQNPPPSTSHHPSHFSSRPHNHDRTRSLTMCSVRVRI
jgi:hypothetical protein